MITIRCETGEDVTVAAESLVGASLSNLNLHRALLSGQSLAGSDLSQSDLRSASLEGADFTGANFSRTRLPACSAARANFTRANLTGALMRSGSYEAANFTEADFSGADVGLARFRSAILRGTKLHRAVYLSDADLTGALADDMTTWPAGFDPRAKGVVFGPSG